MDIWNSRVLLSARTVYTPIETEASFSSDSMLSIHRDYCYNCILSQRVPSVRSSRISEVSNNLSPCDRVCYTCDKGLRTTVVFQPAWMAFASNDRYTRHHSQLARDSSIATVSTSRALSSSHRASAPRCPTNVVACLLFFDEFLCVCVCVRAPLSNLWVRRDCDFLALLDCIAPHTKTISHRSRAHTRTHDDTIKICST